MIWLAQTALIALVLFMLWHPAISVARLRPQQNVVAVLVDHSRSMGIADDGKPRLQNAEDVLDNQLLPDLSKTFPGAALRVRTGRGTRSIRRGIWRRTTMRRALATV